MLIGFGTWWVYVLSVFISLVRNRSKARDSAPLSFKVLLFYRPVWSMQGSGFTFYCLRKCAQTRYLQVKYGLVLVSAYVFRHFAGHCDVRMTPSSLPLWRTRRTSHGRGLRLIIQRGRPENRHNLILIVSFLNIYKWYHNECSGKMRSKMSASAIAGRERRQCKLRKMEQWNSWRRPYR